MTDRSMLWHPARRQILLVPLMLATMPFGVAAMPALSARDERFRRALGRNPSLSPPIGLYRSAVRSGNLLFLSTAVARNQSGPIYSGLLGRDLTVAQGQDAARLSALSLLEVAYFELGGSLEHVVRLVEMVGYVASASGFTGQADVMNGASALMVAILGPEAGISARSAIGVATLPRNAAVAVSCRFEIAT